MLDTSITRFFGDANYSFRLTAPMITELERLTSRGIGAVYRRMLGLECSHQEIVEVVRLGLIGGGLDPERAAALCAAYAAPAPIARTYQLAVDVLDAAWNGTAKDSTDEQN
jgi:hypothetical protein